MKLKFLIKEIEMKNLKSRISGFLSNDKVKTVIVTVAACAAVVVIYGVAFEIAKSQMNFMFEKSIDILEATNKGDTTEK